MYVPHPEAFLFGFASACCYYFVVNKYWTCSLVSLLVALYPGKAIKSPWIFTTPIRDFQFFARNLKFLKQMKIHKNEKQTIIDLYYQVLEKYPQKVCFYFEDAKMTFAQVEAYSNQVAHAFIKLGYKRGDVIGLLMDNRIEYPVIWLAFAKIGVISSLINANLRKTALNHAIDIVNCKGLIFDEEHFSAIEQIHRDIRKDVELFTFTTSSIDTEKLTIDPEKLHNIQSLLKTSSSEKLSYFPLEFSDLVLYIYTSGTTGLPKAAKFTSAKILMLAISYPIILKIDIESDIIYSPLPMYHLATGVLGIAPAFFRGMTVVLRSKFSASNLITDCIKYNVTAVQYIGETCRYLLQTPESAYDRKHNIRKFLGNGLKKNVWIKMIERYGVTDFNEFYGSSEGNGSMCNFVGKIGSCGFIPNIIPDKLNPFALVKYDINTGEPIRTRNGLCVKVDTNEPGLLLSVIKDNVLNDFQGYADSNETKKKVIKDVSKKGDRYYNTGDILMRDKYGFFYFLDRSGDTFRWKGENVSTTEVENILSMAMNCDICVYGVVVPGCEGRAGMATFSGVRELYLEEITRIVNENLPKYARPLFLRLSTESHLTTTFKIKKTKFREEAFDFNSIFDPLFIYLENKYQPLSGSIYQNIQDLKIKL